jgi:hypothetical protein
MLMLIAGISLIAVGAALDTFFRLRMTRLGHKWAFLQGGIFNYSRYHKARKQYGWPVWPIYVMWVSVLCGIVLSIAGFITQFRTAHG